MAVKIDDSFSNLNWLRKNPAPVGFKPKKKSKKKLKVRIAASRKK